MLNLFRFSQEEGNRNSYESANATTVNLFCPAPDSKTLTYKKGQYTREIAIEIDNEHVGWKIVTSDKDLPWGKVSYTGTTVINNSNASRIEMDCDYNISGKKNLKHFSLKLKLDLRKKLYRSS